MSTSSSITNLIVVVRVDVRLVRQYEQLDERDEHTIRVEQNGRRAVLPAAKRGPVVELDDNHRERRDQRAEARHDAHLQSERFRLVTSLSRSIGGHRADGVKWSGVESFSSALSWRTCRAAACRPRAATGGLRV